MGRADAKGAAAARPRKRKARNASVRLSDVRARPLPTPLDWNAALAMVRAGWSVAELAREYGHDQKTIRRELRRLGWEPERKWERMAEPLGPRLYTLWGILRRRCEDPRAPDYPRYGARGVRFAAAWQSFDAFYDWAMRVGYRPGLRILRIDRSGHFGPGNCRFGTAREAQKGWRTASPQRWLRAFGERKGLAQWARDRRCKVTLSSLRDRLAAGWPVEQAIGLPLGAQPSRRVARSRPSGRKPPGSVDWEEARRLYARGEDTKRLAARYGVVPSTIAHGLRRHGVRLRPRASAFPNAETRHLRGLWRSILRRCESPASSSYRCYGARGIRLTRAWRDFERFHAWARASGWRPGLKLVRKEKSKGYSPSNCLFATPAEAARFLSPTSERPPVRLLTAFGETRGLAEWSRDPRCDVHMATIAQRLAKGWSTEEAIALPPQNRGTRDHPRTALEAFGTVKGMADWVRDRRCRISRSALDARLRRGWTPEDAIATRPFARPGGRRRGGIERAARTRRRRRPA